MSRLREILLNEAGDAQERLHAALCLIHLGGVQEPAAIQHALHAISWVESIQVANLTGFLQPVVDAVRTPLLERCTNRESNSQSKARYAIILLQLGDRRGAEHVLQLDANPVDRTEFIHNAFPKWHAALRLLQPALSPNDVLKDDEITAAFRSGLCSAMALLPELSPEDREVVIPLLKRLGTDAPDGGTRSVCDYALRRFGEAGLEAKRANRPDPGRHWFVNSLGMAMVKIPPGTLVIGDGDNRRTIQVERPFFMQDREVAHGLFREFYESITRDGDQPKEPYQWRGVTSSYTPTTDPDHGPALNMSWFSAVQFCNWLSEREQRRPYYVRSGRTEPISLPPNRGGGVIECDVWEIDATSNGYRLASRDEWQFACAAMSNGPYCFGNDAGILSEYAVTGLSFATGGSAGRMERCGSRMPNAWGLYDMHGNAAEWCSDPRIGHPGQRTNAEPNVHMPPVWCSTAAISGKNAAVGHEILGFRVVCP
jgi:formylglycine-generating enzyme required for sulfatase activity